MNMVNILFLCQKHFSVEMLQPSPCAIMATSLIRWVFTIIPYSRMQCITHARTHTHVCVYAVAWQSCYPLYIHVYFCYTYCSPTPKHYVYISLLDIRYISIYTFPPKCVTSNISRFHFWKYVNVAIEIAWVPKKQNTPLFNQTQSSTVALSEWWRTITSQSVTAF